MYSFLGNIGGMLSLFLGISVVTLLELIEGCFKSFEASKRRKRSDMYRHENGHVTSLSSGGKKLPAVIVCPQPGKP